MLQFLSCRRVFGPVDIARRGQSEIKSIMSMQETLREYDITMVNYLRLCHQRLAHARILLMNM